MSFTNFTNQKTHSFGGEYLELVPNERIRHTDKFDDPNLPGVMQVTIVLKKVLVGTEVNITQEGVPAVIPPEACYLGWQESLTLLLNSWRLRFQISNDLEASDVSCFGDAAFLEPAIPGTQVVIAEFVSPAPRR